MTDGPLPAPTGGIARLTEDVILLRIAAPAGKIWSENENTNPLLLEAGVVWEKATASINDAEDRSSRNAIPAGAALQGRLLETPLDPLSAIQDK